ncbi:MAG: 30S ribosomal protein S27e [Candidatus Micrarchaeota archaeon]
MSRYMKVKCECGNEQVIFESASSRVGCRVCNKRLVEPRGGKCIVVGGTIVSEME